MLTLPLKQNLSFLLPLTFLHFGKESCKKLQFLPENIIAHGKKSHFKRKKSPIFAEWTATYDGAEDCSSSLSCHPLYQKLSPSVC
jgi:hypothetical protein